MGIFAGVARRLTNLQSVPIENDLYNSLFGAGSLLGIPSLILWTILAVGIGYFVFRETRFGAHVHAVGDSARAARATGIKVLRLRFAVMVLSGTLAGLAGLLYAGPPARRSLHAGRGRSPHGDRGGDRRGTRLNGGAGSIVGALIGSLMMEC